MKGLVAATGEFIDIGPAHPVADLFPMLAGEDLEELVQSVYEQGLLQPIVLDAEGRVLDGRNRLAACERLDVIPEVLVYDGDDPDGYALTVNIARRHLNKGQRAMLVAKAGCKNYSEVEVSGGYVSHARTVLDHAPDLADAVIAGARSLDEAYKVAQDQKRARADETAQMAKLRAEAPDLADLVPEELTLPEAMGALRERKAEEQRQRTVATHLLCQNVVAVAQLHGGTTGERYDPDLALPGRAVTRQVLTAARAAIDELLSVWEERRLP